MSILIFGGLGQLGQCIKKVADAQAINGIVYLDEVSGNILDAALLEEVFTRYKPQYVINCAAYTAVDKAEDEIDLARKINKIGPANLADACVKHEATLIHISTDFVFAGNTPKLLNEQDKVAPISIYGLTKLEGEQEISQRMTQYFILRTSWLYSEFANNFVKTMLRLGKERPELGIIADQIGTPTYGVDLAKCVLHIIQTASKQYGLYHYSNEGAVSWYDFAQAIFELGKVPVKVKPLKTSEYPTKAQRPAFSVLDKTKIKQTFLIDIPYWKISLQECMQNI